MQDALKRIDDLMRRLIEADQTGSGIEPLKMASELSTIRMSLVQGRAVIPRAKGGERHFRCETCGTITHGTAAPTKCLQCGSVKFFEADLEGSIVDAGPG